MLTIKERQASLQATVTGFQLFFSTRKSLKFAHATPKILSKILVIEEKGEDKIMYNSLS